ncbi:protein TonB [Aquimarina sp. MAR_2010_214]|uniref:energy transducer TonB n=1 Tax=Aquimarina sp. MAR_2010_214 TaxID=1250026 RepID=UPI000C711D14|nr:energy transducer TonB [Aquimarina sp. MAR_2010_214]PKV49453.1 protein TonB [Aquimarina sp. MAR_2010_214]
MSNKHDANVRKSTLVNFQIGLIASLLFTYVMFEMYTATPIVNDSDIDFTIEEPDVDWDGVYKIYEEPRPKEIARKYTKPVIAPEQFKVIDNDAEITDLDKVFKNETIESKPFDPNSIVDVEPIVDEPITLPFMAVEDVPIFPGCEKLATNKEKAACFSEKIRKIVSRKFDAGLGEEYGLTGVQRIYTQFDVDTDGMIKNIRVRAAHPKLKKEAQRVINLFPQMTPGKQRGRAVTVKYQLPIVFKIQN